MNLTPLLAAALLPAAVSTATDPPVDPAVMHPYQAHATIVTGEVSRIRNSEPWAVSGGERIPIRQIITTGADGYAHFELRGGSSFDIYANSKVVFRQNAADPGDLLDVVAGHVRVRFQPSFGHIQRIFCPTAIVTAHVPATVALALDADETVRIDVMDGEVRVQHALLPRNEPTLVHGVDAILVHRDEPISRRVDRGSLYRYTVKILSAITLGHSGRAAEPVEGKQFLPDASAWLTP